ncbi:MAG: BatD family protein [Isosphaeraceae bacterium]
MCRLCFVLIAAHVGLASAAAIGAQVPERALRVLAQARPTVAYVGQSVDLVVGVVAGRERPRLTLPRIDGAELDYLRTELVPMNLSSIGDMIADRNLYRFRYRLVPRVAGTLNVPPIVVSLGEARGASPPLRISVQAVPTAGRPAGFLGGVGAFEMETSAEPASTRVGEPFTYTLTVTGPAARGIHASPDVSRMASLPIAPTLERLPDVVSGEPPSRQFRFRVRPTRPGEVTLPPITVSSFDPTTETYRSKVAPGVAVRVVEPPRFDPATVAYGGPEPDPPRSETGWWWWALVVGLACLAVVVEGWRRRGSKARVLRRALVRQLARIDRAASDAEVGRLINEGLVEYLRIGSDRPPGALTPLEGGEAVERATGSEALARQAREVLEWSDRARFGTASASPGGLADQGRSLLRALAKRSQD